MLFAIAVMRGGSVAENSAVCRSAGVAARIASRSSAKPMSSISSASSSTTIFTAARCKRAAPDMIERAARRGDDDVDAALQRADLTFHRSAAIDRHRDDSERLAIFVHGLGNLHRELARRHEHQRRGALARRSVRCDEVQQRQRERGGLSRSRRGLREHVAPFEQRRNCGALDGRWLFVSERGERGEEPFVESEG